MKPKDQFFQTLERLYPQSINTTLGVMNAIVEMDKDYQKKKLHELFNYPPSEIHRDVVAATIQYYSGIEPKFTAILKTLYEVIDEFNQENPSTTVYIDQLTKELTGETVNWVDLAIESMTKAEEYAELLEEGGQYSGKLTGPQIVYWWAWTSHHTALKEIMTFVENATSSQIRSLSRDIKEGIREENSLDMMIDPESDNRKEQLTVLREQLINQAKELGKL